MKVGDWPADAGPVLCTPPQNANKECLSLHYQVCIYVYRFILLQICFPVFVDCLMQRTFQIEVINCFLLNHALMFTGYVSLRDQKS